MLYKEWVSSVVPGLLCECGGTRCRFHEALTSTRLVTAPALVAAVLRAGIHQTAKTCGIVGRKLCCNTHR